MKKKKEKKMKKPSWDYRNKDGKVGKTESSTLIQKEKQKEKLKQRSEWWEINREKVMRDKDENGGKIRMKKKKTK